MRAAALWARAQTRRRLVGLVAVGLLAGLGGGAAMGAFAGARRAATAYDRHLEATTAPHALVSPRGADPFGRDGELRQFAGLPGVVGHTQLDALLARPAGSDFEFGLAPWFMGAYDSRYGVEEARFRIVDGRAYDHTRDDEAVITEQLADLLDLEVGDALRLETMTPATRDAVFLGEIEDSPKPDGPSVEVRVVGIARDFGIWGGYPDPPQVTYLTHAFTRRWDGRIARYAPGMLLRLAGEADGYADFAATARQLAERLPGEWELVPTGGHNPQVSGAIDAQRLALVIFGVTAAGAALAVAFAALGRQLSFVVADQAALRALGMTPGARTAGAVLIAAPAAGIGALTAVGLAFASSTLLPIGTPGDVEPQPGLVADGLVLSVGGFIVLLAVLGLAAIVAAGLTRVQPARVAQEPGRLAALAAAWLPRPASIGVQLAVERGRGARTLPTRSTIAGCVVGVVGVTAALVFSAGLTHLTTTRQLYGWQADAIIGVGNDPDAWRDANRELAADRRIDGLATLINVALTVNGTVGYALVFEPVRGDPLNVVVSGRTPITREEIAVGRGLADNLDVGVGDSVSIALADGATREHVVVGIVANPHVDVSYRDQLAVLGDDIREYDVQDPYPWHGAAVTFRDGVDTDAALAEYRSKGASVIEPQEPRQIVNLEEIDAIPTVLAVVLGALGIAFVAHALTTAVRRRGPDLAVLKALGFSRRQLRGAVDAQATTIALAGVCLGVPIGAILGRAAWSLVATRLGVRLELTPPWPLLIIAVAVLLVANVVAIPSGRRAARVDPAVQLRTP